MSVYVDTSENLHPFECDGPGKCCHCDRRHVEHLRSPKPLYSHDPANCALCDPEYDHLPNPYMDRVEQKGGA